MVNNSGSSVLDMIAQEAHALVDARITITPGRCMDCRCSTEFTYRVGYTDVCEDCFQSMADRLRAKVKQAKATYTAIGYIRAA
jgi:hypothetical protein